MAYSPEKRAEVLVILESNNGNIEYTSEQTGVPRKTIYAWLEEKVTQKPIAIETEKLMPATREEFTKDLTSLRNKVLAHLEDTYLDLKPREAVVALGILIDKTELLSGNATSRTAIVEEGDDSIDSAVRELAALLTANDANSASQSNVAEPPSEEIPITAGNPVEELDNSLGSGMGQDSNGRGVDSLESTPEA